MVDTVSRADEVQAAAPQAALADRRCGPRRWSRLAELDIVLDRAGRHVGTPSRRLELATGAAGGTSAAVGRAGCSSEATGPAGAGRS